jgi:hypothetical protein
MNLYDAYPNHKINVEAEQRRLDSHDRRTQAMGALNQDHENRINHGSK